MRESRLSTGVCGRGLGEPKPSPATLCVCVCVCVCVYCFADFIHDVMGANVRLVSLRVSCHDADYSFRKAALSEQLGSWTWMVARMRIVRENTSRYLACKSRRCGNK